MFKILKVKFIVEFHYLRAAVRYWVWKEHVNISGAEDLVNGLRKRNMNP